MFVSGLQDRAETWSKTLVPSEQAVFPAIAKTTRVCAYDRPGTVLIVGEDFEKSCSDPVPQPITLEEPVADLRALLTAIGVPGPYVLVGYSARGAFARYYASKFPEEVSGSSSSITSPTSFETD
ncbi:MAG: alpha/beta fold hydrolase [Thermodesulfobacteriota bacterium]